ncbi:MAG TPA: ABC transporter permease [Actinomycetes bacterium]|nr:ABC transporter permease [Actinomycetes bacterium]
MSTTEVVEPGVAVPPPSRRVSGFFHRHPRLQLAGLLSAPMLWLVVAYLGALAAMFVTALWTTNPFTNDVVRVLNWDNFRQLVTDPAYPRVALRSVTVAALVTITCAVIALPMGFFMAQVVRPRWRGVLVVAVLTPLWASYLVKVYAWRVILQSDGVLDSVLGPLGLSSPGFGLSAIVIVLTYLWLPYMILPVYAGFERMPASYVEASADLGARPVRTFRSVMLPVVFPALVAGSIFTFSLSLGDYITAQIVGGQTQLIGNVVYTNIVLNRPFAAAVATVPVAVMVIYLMAVRRTGALDNL